MAEVLPDTPAHTAGFKAGDVIVEFDRRPVEKSGDLPMIVARTPVGKAVDVKVMRDGDERTLRVEIGELLDEKAVAAVEQGSDLGLTVLEVTDSVAKRFSLKRTGGVLVTGVKPGSPADQAGLRRGDVILEMNRTLIPDLAAYKKAA